MKKLLLLTKTLLAVVLLCVGASNAWAQVPTPVYFNDFSSTDGLTIVGSGEFIEDADAKFGQIYHNNPDGNVDRRSNYLLLPESVLTHSGTSNAMTIGFWVNRKSDTGYFYCPLFSAYKTTTPGVNNGSPMFICQSRGLLQVNDDAGKWSDFTATNNDKGTNAESTTWLDDNEWHYYTVTLTSTTAKVYVDGVIVNSWTMDGTSDGQVISGLFSAGAAGNLPKVCLGGNQAWGWDDKDASFGFDDFAVYDVALTAEQIEQIIDTKYGYTTVYERTSEAGTNQWSAADVTAWGSAANLAIDGNNQLGFSGVVGNASYSVSTTANALVRYKAEWYAQSTANDQTNPAYLQLGSLVIKVRDSYQSNLIAFSVDGGSSFGSEKSTKNTAKWIRDGRTITVNAIINSASKTIESFSLTFDGVTYTEADLPSTSISNANTIGLKTASSGSYIPSSKLNKIKVSELEQAVTNVDYTINYKLGDNLVKSVAGDGVVDQVVTADAAIDGTEGIYVGNHYLIVAAEAPSMTLIDGENILDVPVRAPYTATLNVTRTIGGVAQTPVVTNLVETDAKVCNWNYTYSLYVQKDGVYYVADVTSSFGESGIFTNGQVIEKSVTYSTVDESVVFFQEAEAAAGTNYSYSNGGTGNVATQNKRDRGISVGTLDAGVYSFTANITAANRRSLGIRQSTNDHLASVGTSNEDMTTGVKSANFTLNEETSSLFINGANSGSDKTNQSEDFDYVLIKKLPSTVSKTITAAGWATYCSPYALDLEHATGLTNAYIVTGASENILNTTSVKGGTIPANTGILIEAPEGTVTIPVVASSSTDVSGNKFQGVTEATEIAANAGYVLMASPSLGFYKNANAFTVGANTAYLPANIAAGSARSAFFFGGNITAVDNVEAAAEAKAKDGKFIENGKLVIVKNGVKYNAAGAQVK